MMPRSRITTKVLFGALTGLVLASGCTIDSRERDKDDERTGTCASACQQIYDCELCVTAAEKGAAFGCLTQGECTDSCIAGRYGGEFVACVVAVDSCNKPSLEQCISSTGKGGTGGTGPGTGGTAPGTGGAAPGTGGAAPGTRGAAPGTGGADPGTGASFPGD